jgi:hypothetical protein
LHKRQGLNELEYPLTRQQPSDTKDRRWTVASELLTRKAIGRGGTHVPDDEDPRARAELLPLRLLLARENKNAVGASEKSLRGQLEGPGAGSDEPRGLAPVELHDDQPISRERAQENEVPRERQPVVRRLHDDDTKTAADDRAPSIRDVADSSQEFGGQPFAFDPPAPRKQLDLTP